MRIGRILSALALLLPWRPVHAEMLSVVPLDAEVLRRPVTDSAPVTMVPNALIRLSPDLGGDAEAVKAVVAASAARIGEPAQYELRTKPDFPLTLQLVNLWEPEAQWKLSMEPESMGVRFPRTVEPGNLELGDFAGPLREKLDAIGRVERLVGRAAGAGERRSVTCFGLAQDIPLPPTCDVPVETHDSGAVPMPSGSGKPNGVLSHPGADLRFAVGNRSAKPQYVALLLIDADNRIMRLPFADAPLAPGAWAQSDSAWQPQTTGRLFAVTLSSDRPIPPDIAESGLTDADGISVAVAQWQVDSNTPTGIGGGLDVPPFAAPWMAEFYSTVPYTAAEIAADRAKPAAEREFLDERSRQELAHRCGGTLIAPDLVLTAAHCVAKGNFAGADAVKVFRTRRVRLGTLELGGSGPTFAIDAMAVHAGYRDGETPNDIALLRLKPDRDSPASNSGNDSFIRPIALLAGRDPAPELTARVPVTAYGWGYTGAVEAGAQPLFSQGQLQHNPRMLQMGRMQALGWDACRKRMGDLLGNNMICTISPTDAAGRAIGNVFSCRGDSGGPLIRTVKGQDMLIGIASWSRGCGNYPSVYTNVARYGGWVEQARTQLKAGEVARVDTPPPAAAARPPARQ